MNSSIYKHEFHTHLKSVIIWSLSILVLIFVFTSLFPALAMDAEILAKTMAEFPPELLMAFGMTGMDWSSVLGYFSFVFVFLQLILAVQAAGYGVGLVSVEERELTADFLMTKPVSRNQILTSKYLAALTALLVTDLVVWISSFVLLNIFSDGRQFDAKALILLLLSILAFQLFFLTAGVLISLLVKRVRSVTPYAMALAFGMYVLSVFGDMLGESILEKITPFKHFDPGYIIEHAAYSPLALVSLAVILVSVVGSYMLYTRRNIPSVT